MPSPVSGSLRIGLPVTWEGGFAAQWQGPEVEGHARGDAGWDLRRVLTTLPLQGGGTGGDAVVPRTGAISRGVSALLSEGTQ